MSPRAPRAAMIPHALKIHDPSGPAPPEDLDGALARLVGRLGRPEALNLLKNAARLGYDVAARRLLTPAGGG